MVFAGVFELGQHIAHGVDACALFVVGLDGHPRGLIGVGVAELFFLGAGVVVPLIQRGQVHGGKLPLAHWVDLADREAGALFFLCHREPELGEADA